jgi:hypothetical protein
VTEEEAAALTVALITEYRTHVDGEPWLVVPAVEGDPEKSSAVLECMAAWLVASVSVLCTMLDDDPDRFIRGLALHIADGSYMKED